jgi:tRNA (cmo5U34)-methyltransferase
MSKSTVEQIKERFDNSVERFSNSDSGNTAQMDSVMSMTLIAEAAALVTPHAKSVLDVGCGGGNYVLKLLEYSPALDVTLLDLSQPMLERARNRVQQAGAGAITLMQGDIRAVDIGREQYDIIVASAILHHLREETEWELVFAKLYQALKPGGSLWIYDLVEQAIPELNATMHRLHGDYLVQHQDAAFRDTVFGWIEMEDSPRPLMYQLDLMRSVGFRTVDVLHKHSRFAAFGGVK